MFTIGPIHFHYKFLTVTQIFFFFFLKKSKYFFVVTNITSQNAFNWA